MKAHLELSTNMAAKYIALTLSALYVVMLSVMSTAHAPDAIHGNGFWPNIYDKPIGEDGFYMLTISWNLAQTGRFEYNLGDVSTGIQPLMTVIMAIALTH